MLTYNQKCFVAFNWEQFPYMYATFIVWTILAFVASQYSIDRWGLVLMRCGHYASRATYLINIEVKMLCSAPPGIYITFFQHQFTSHQITRWTAKLQKKLSAIHEVCIQKKWTILLLISHLYYNYEKYPLFLWNRGFWRSLNNTYPIYLTPCIRCTNHLCDSYDLIDVNPHFIPSLPRKIQNVHLLWRHRYKSRPPAIVTSQWPIVPAWLLWTLS